MSQEQENIRKSQITQLTYRSEQYSDTTWEVVGERIEDHGFIPMEFQAISHAQVTVDPMFADYGGLENVEEDRRWHMPEGMSGNPITEREAREAAIKEAERQKEEDIKRKIIEAEERGKASALEEFASTQNEKLAHIEQRMSSILQDLAKQLSQNLSLIEKDAVELSVEISEKLVGNVVEINPEYITQIVGEALRQTGSAKILKVKVSPEDMEFIEVVGISKSFKEFDGTWSFEPDSTVRAGCIVETSAGQIDYQIDKAWERIKDSVMKVIR